MAAVGAAANTRKTTSIFSSLLGGFSSENPRPALAAWWERAFFLGRALGRWPSIARHVGFRGQGYSLYQVIRQLPGIARTVQHTLGAQSVKKG